MMFFHSFGGGIEMKGGGGGVDEYGDHQQQRPKGGFVATKQQLQEHHHQLHQQEQQPKPECYSDEVDSRSGDGGRAESEQPQVKKKKRKSSSSAAAGPPVKAASGGDGATVEVMRRPRGRPPGSKNKPKPPVFITRDADADPSSAAAMRPHVIEIPNGEDVVDGLARFSRRRGLGLSVLAGTGVVSNVIIRPNLSFQGHFEILSISATFFPPAFAPSPPSALPAGGGGGFSIALSGPQGQIFGGIVAGPLTAAGTVTILAATFCNPTYHRLPAEDDVSVSVSVSGGGDVETARGFTAQPQRQPRQQHNASSRQHPQRQQPSHSQQQQQRSASPPSSSSDAPAAAAAAQHYGHHHLHHPAAVVAAPAAGESCGMSIYGGHLPSDVIWAPAARSPPY